MRAIIFSLFVSFFLSNVSFGQAKPIVSGDVITIENYKAEQIGSQPVTFKEAPEVRTYRMSIQENGDRHYLRPGGTISFITDKLFTRTANGLRPSGTKPVEENARFKLFPQNQKLEAGMQWDISYWGTTKNCGGLKVNYHATSKSGPDINVTVDGIDTKINTILVALEGSSSNACGGQFRLEHNVLYSPDLDEIVSDKFTDLEGAFLYAGYKRILKSIKTGGGAVGADKSAGAK